jgi:hypothetical protein
MSTARDLGDFALAASEETGRLRAHEAFSG